MPKVFALVDRGNGISETLELQYPTAGHAVEEAHGVGVIWVRSSPPCLAIPWHRILELYEVE